MGDTQLGEALGSPGAPPASLGQLEGWGVPMEQRVNNARPRLAGEAGAGGGTQTGGSDLWAQGSGCHPGRRLASTWTRNTASYQ